MELESQDSGLINPWKGPTLHDHLVQICVDQSESSVEQGRTIEAAEGSQLRRVYEVGELIKQAEL